MDLAVLQCAWRDQYGHFRRTGQGHLHPLRRPAGCLGLLQRQLLPSGIFYNRKPGGPDQTEAAILAELYPIHARFALDILARNPLPFDRQQVGDLIEVHCFIDRAGQKLPAYREARRQIRQAVIDGIEQGRFGKLNHPMDVCALLNVASDWGNTEAMPFLKKLADRGFQGRPVGGPFVAGLPAVGPATHACPKDRVLLAVLSSHPGIAPFACGEQVHGRFVLRLWADVLPRRAAEIWPTRSCRPWRPSTTRDSRPIASICWP